MAMKKKKILFVINTISGGGAERIMQDLLFRLDRNEFELFLYVLYWTGKEENVVPADVKYFIGSARTIYGPLINLFHLFWVVLRVNPDSILSFLWQANILSAFTAFVTGKKILLGEHTLPDHCMEEYSLKAIRKKLLGAAYRSADKAVAVSDNAKKSLVDYFSLKEDKAVVIENGIDVAKIQGLSLEKANCPYGEYLISIGRLEPVKNFSYLLDIIYQLRIKFGIDLPLVIVGEGKERVALGAKAARLGVRLFMPGFLENPYPLIKGAKLFLVTSNYESFHLGIIEAMACGTPVVSVNCPGGISGIIRSDENGILVGPADTQVFAGAAARILNDKELASRLAANARTMAEKKYNIQLMISKYESLLQ